MALTYKHKGRDRLLIFSRLIEINKELNKLTRYY
jgi:hypothetical protein